MIAKPLETALFSALVFAGVSCCNTAPPPQQPMLPPVRGEAKAARPVATFSIVARDAETGDLAVAVQSKYFGVGSVVPWAKADVGAIATQSYANPAYGSVGLKLLEAGNGAEKTLKLILDTDEGRERRQVGMIDAEGNTACFTGSECNEWAGHEQGDGFAVQGNLLAGPEVIKAMSMAFQKARQQAEGELADWMVAALAAGQEAGGDRRGQQSAALLVVREKGGYGKIDDRFIDLRVEDHREPIRELGRLLKIHKEFYASRRKNPPRRTERQPAPERQKAE